MFDNNPLAITSWNVQVISQSLLCTKENAFLKNSYDIC